MRTIGQCSALLLAEQAADAHQPIELVKPTKTFIANKAQETGRLEGPICGAFHWFKERTPGHQDAAWVGPHCRHLDLEVWVFGSRKAAEAAAEKDRLP